MMNKDNCIDIFTDYEIKSTYHEDCIKTYLNYDLCNECKQALKINVTPVLYIYYQDIDDGCCENATGKINNYLYLSFFITYFKILII